MKSLILTMAFASVLAPAFAQHHHHTPEEALQPQHQMQDQMDDDDSSMHQDHHAAAPAMTHFLSRNLPMNRNGSGTGWNPDNSPMYMYMKHAGPWMFMLHGNVFVRYNHQDITGSGSRGGDGWDAPNMMMAMTQRNVGKKGIFHASLMLSADALITGQGGYPLLFQSGETAHGEPLVDRQHPHDLFSELSMSYAHSFNRDLDVYAYVGYPGEPALGATTFMHRAGGMDMPDAPISHHWVDATHITFGVATAGVRYGKFKLEGSSFTGREPGENRYNFDKPRFDSRSARLWFNPSAAWSMQVSHGFLKSPETVHPDDVYRTTASVSYSRKGRGERFFNATALWGMNKKNNHDGEHALLTEAALRRERLVVYGRYEWVQKSAEELQLDRVPGWQDGSYNVNTLTLGAGYDLLHNTPVRVSLGAQASVYKADDRLNSLYGDMPLSAQVYLRFYPGLMKM
jgi:hypothetical protein